MNTLHARPRTHRRLVGTGGRTSAGTRAPAARNVLQRADVQRRIDYTRAAGDGGPERASFALWRTLRRGAVHFPHHRLSLQRTLVSERGVGNGVVAFFENVRRWMLRHLQGRAHVPKFLGDLARGPYQRLNRIGVNLNSCTVQECLEVEGRLHEDYDGKNIAKEKYLDENCSHRHCNY